MISKHKNKSRVRNSRQIKFLGPLLGDSYWFGSPKVSHNSHTSTSANSQTNNEELTNKYKITNSVAWWLLLKRARDGVPRWAIIHRYPQTQFTNKLIPLHGDSYWRGPGSPKVGDHSQISTNTIYKQIQSLLNKYRRIDKQIQKNGPVAWWLLLKRVRESQGGRSFTGLCAPPNASNHI